MRALAFRAARNTPLGETLGGKTAAPSPPCCGTGCPASRLATEPWLDAVPLGDDDWDDADCGATTATETWRGEISQLSQWRST